MNGWQMLLWGSVGVGVTGIGLPLAYRAAIRVFDDVYERIRAWRHDKLTLAHIAVQNKLQDVRAFQADERGRYPLLYGENGVLRDPNNLRLFTLQTVLERFPYLENIDARIRLVIGAGGWPPAQVAEHMLPSQATRADGAWRAYTLDEMLAGRRPSIHSLVVGAHPGADGKLEVVSRSLHDLMHTLAVGASGWGKSTWLRAFLYQVARSPEPCEVCAIDINGSEFNALRGWGRLRYPVAREPRDAISVLGAVGEEIAKRKELYEAHPLAVNLAEYNDATGAGLPPWVVVVDEGTNLLNQSGIGEPLRAAVQCARQYGLYVLLAGQSAKHSVVDTQVRDNFSSRLCFRTSPTSSRVVLDDRSAGDLHDKGRAMVQLVGTELQELQGPWVGRDDFIKSLSNGGPKYTMPVREAPAPRGGPTSEQVRQVLEMHEQGESKRAIERAVFGFEGGAAYRQVTEILATTATTTIKAVDLEKNDEKSPSTRGSRSVDFCDFCRRSADDAPAGVTFAACAACGVGVCSDDGDGQGRCPDCTGGE
jgi:hypothetical protein